jgi:hypothetical protein
MSAGLPLSNVISMTISCALQGFNALQLRRLKRCMERVTMNFPFEIPFDQVLASIDEYISVIFSSLESEFLILPKGQASLSTQFSRQDMRL